MLYLAMKMVHLYIHEMINGHWVDSNTHIHVHNIYEVEISYIPAENIYNYVCFYWLR